MPTMTIEALDEGVERWVDRIDIGEVGVVLLPVLAQVEMRGL